MINKAKNITSTRLRTNLAALGILLMTTITAFHIEAAQPSVKAADTKIYKTNRLVRHDFPYASNFVEVAGSLMHFVDTGGDKPTILLVHGQPTWSYLWRNVIPGLEPHFRVIAVDLIGFGLSDKPPIDYTLADHAKYFDGFIRKLELNDFYLGIHDWGSFLGFDFAARFPNKIKGIAFMEAIMMQDAQEPEGDPNRAVTDNFFNILTQLRTPGVGEKMILEDNFFIEKLLLSEPSLSEDEKQAYRMPFIKGSNRLPMLEFPRQISFDGVNPEYVVAGIGRISGYLQQTRTPMLMLTFTPGALIGSENIKWAKANIDNLNHQHLGKGVHFVQEAEPEKIARSIADWYVDLK